MDFLATPVTGFLNQLRPMELLIIAFIVLLLFGAKRLPDLFRSMGRSIGEFKKATREIEDEVRSAMDTESTPSSKPDAESHKPTEPEPVDTAENQEPAEKKAEPVEKKD